MWPGLMTATIRKRFAWHTGHHVRSTSVSRHIRTTTDSGAGGTDRQLSKIADPNRSNGPWARITTCSNLHIRVGEARGDRQVTEPPVRPGVEAGHPPLHLNQPVERRLDSHPYPPVPGVLPCGIPSERAAWAPVDYRKGTRVKLKSRRGETGAR